MKLIQLTTNNSVWAIISMEVDKYSEKEITNKIYESIYNIGKKLYNEGQDYVYADFINMLMEEYKTNNLIVNRLHSDLMDEINLDEVYDKIVNDTNNDALEILEKIDNLNGLKNKYDFSEITVQELINELKNNAM